MSDLSVNLDAGTVDIGIEQAKGHRGLNKDENAPGAKITAGQVRKFWDDGVRIIRPEQRLYWINRAFIRGEQWLYFDKQRDKIMELPRDDRVRATINKMAPASRALAAKANKRELHFEVTPQSPDDENILGAEIAESVLEDLAREHRWEELRDKEWWARWEGGTSLLCLDWDPKAGTPLGKNADTDEHFGTGEIKETVLSIAEACTEPGERDIETARWWIKVSTMPPHKAKDVYRLNFVPQADASQALSPFQTKVLMSDSREVMMPMTLVLTYYERPNFENPDGQVAVVIGEQVVQWAKWPYPFKDRQNVVCFREMKIQDRWNGDTILSSAQPVQTGYNASWSSILEHLKQASNARLAVPDTSIDSIDELTDNPGEMFFYNPAGPAPSYMAPPNMPSWWVQMPTLLDNAMQDILQWHDVSQSQAPANLESGLGLSILGEGDNSPIEAMIKETANGWARFAKMVLKVYESKVTESRTARVTGAGKAPRTVRWNGKSFKGNTDVQVPLDAIMPESEAAAHARAQAMWDRGIIKDPEQYAKVARMPYAKDLISALDPDIAKAKRENLDLAGGTSCIPADFDDHTKHIAAHNDFRKSEQYDHLVDTPVDHLTDQMTGQKTPVTAKDLVDLHVKAHETLAAEAAGQQLAQQMVHPALGGSPNANGQQPVPDGGAPLAPIPTSAMAPPGAPPAPGEGGVGPGQPDSPDDSPIDQALWDMSRTQRSLKTLGGI